MYHPVQDKQHKQVDFKCALKEEGDDIKPLYKYSFDEAKRSGETELYKSSHRENIACANDIKSGIAANFDGYSLNTDFVKDVIKTHGYDRTMFVLANTIQHFDHDGRISQDNKDWARSFFISKDKFRTDFLIEDSGLVDIVAKTVRSMYADLNLWDKNHCEKYVDFTGKITVLKPEILKDKYKSPDYQMFYCTDGFGCSPTASGRAVYGEFVKDCERVRYNREDFLGVLKPEYLPDMAKRFLAEKERPTEKASIKAQLAAAPKQKTSTPKKPREQEL